MIKINMFSENIMAYRFINFSVPPVGQVVKHNCSGELCVCVAVKEWDERNQTIEEKLATLHTVLWEGADWRRPDVIDKHFHFANAFKLTHWVSVINEDYMDLALAIHEALVESFKKEQQQQRQQQ